MSDTANTGQGRDPSSDDRNLAMVGHALMFASPFVFGLNALMAVVIAYVRKPEADPVACSHYRYQIRHFWIAFALAMVAFIALATGVVFLFVDLVRLVVANAPGDAWEAVAMQVNPEMPVVFFVGVFVFLIAYALASLWVIISSVFGMVRLGAQQPVGRASA